MNRLRLRVAPTKSALLALRKHERFLRDGHGLLERKRELLTRLVYERLDEYRLYRRQAHEAISSAYYWLGVTQLKMGGRAIHQATLGASPSVAVKVLPRRALGVQYPSVDAQVLPPQPVGLLGTESSFDEARKAFAEAAVQLAQLAQLEMALYRLITERKKAQKRVNALRYNIIPGYQHAIHRIADALEEEERANLFQIKRLQESANTG